MPTVLIVLGCWFAASIPFALLLGRWMRYCDEREKQSNRRRNPTREQTQIRA